MSEKMGVSLSAISIYLNELEKERKIKSRPIKVHQKQKQERQKKLLELIKHGETDENKMAKEIGISLQTLRIYVQELEKKGKKERKLSETEIKQYKKRIMDLKREIGIEVRFDKQPSEDKKAKIREYIDLCQEVYRKEKIEKTELIFLRQAMHTISIKEKDIVRFSKICIDVGEYKEALDMIRSRNEILDGTTNQESEKALIKLEVEVEKLFQVQRAMQIMKRGNSDIAVVSNVTGLTKDEVGILKIKLEKKPVRILNIEQRRKILELLESNKDPIAIQRKLGITDFEMKDIEEQSVEYRSYKRKCKQASDCQKEELEKQIEQNMRIRIIVLYTKLGKTPEYIANKLKIGQETVEEDLQCALKQKGLIKQEELNGINPLKCYQTLYDEQLK